MGYRESLVQFNAVRQGLLAQRFQEKPWVVPMNFTMGWDLTDKDREGVSRTVLSVTEARV